ncbi:subclass B3 metallo-beta-lactamase [Pseudoxanthomonas daejeonensis]|uniref:subclass B3 metallo-beta-lactamase n=1 Tax=Pseudoxanthomonas daejeonensis TaxID=266062 RepID=UPI00192F1018|nr:subclass B3 metallo-beta-lactamase [Pseudoxanthomonas daejeonensis]UNK57060.1 subclass B3 metallo-beta-lactamase [Pseudoxanthomonas daejeonensis]
MRTLAIAAVALLAPFAVRAGATSAASPAPAPACAADAGWDDPSPPYHLHGDTWFVGTCGITALLVTSPQGHVLLDGGTAKGAALIEANIRAAGFRVEDVRYIVGSHEHFDHAGGIAALQKASGATVVAREPAAVVLESGRSGREDPQFAMLDAMAPVAGVRRIGDGEELSLGGWRLTAHATPGHSPGGTSWTWRSCENGACADIAYVDSLTAISDDEWRFSDHPDYVASLRRTLDAVAVLPCDILVTPHPSASDLWSRLGPGARQPLAQEGACRAYAGKARERLDKRLADEATTPPQR